MHLSQGIRELGGKSVRGLSHRQIVVPSGLHQDKRSLRRRMEAKYKVKPKHRLRLLQGRRIGLVKHFAILEEKLLEQVRLAGIARRERETKWNAQGYYTDEYGNWWSVAHNGGCTTATWSWKSTDSTAAVAGGNYYYSWSTYC